MLRTNLLTRQRAGPFTPRKKNCCKRRFRRLNQSKRSSQRPKPPRRRLPQRRMRCHLRRRSICRRASFEPDRRLFDKSRIEEAKKLLESGKQELRKISGLFLVPAP